MKEFAKFLHLVCAESLIPLKEKFTADGKWINAFICLQMSLADVKRYIEE